MKILAIETSCDETAASVVENGSQVLSDVIYSQIPVHNKYGGVVPEIASRCHLQAIVPVVGKAVADAGLEFKEIDAVAVANGPGLIGSLLVGVSYAKALAQALNKPLIPVNHWQGHISAVFIDWQPQYPFLALVVSGSHSGVVEVLARDSFHLLGQSRDDAAGEAFDKIARALGLGYPGGPAISLAAEKGDKEKYAFPRAKMEGYDLSFSGLKSAVLNHLNREKMQGRKISEQDVCDIAASAQEAICDILSAKAVSAANEHGITRLTLCGGVAANKRLRELLAERFTGELHYPSAHFCTDNAVMIGIAAYDLFLAGQTADLSLNASARLPLYF
ncbi:MAG: tRNA (adenosine(37)-N6)-threonylcarbamoyltransferase complex transferase subunit TsaD [Clostridia bacterium]|nr:tRNA (adenosine(37)-N6)-threonylcarbamoyltransferase complex transferase subunit TsaD [Clostridia bacterium]MDD4798099.1 tRNA (adenosine(37)-N6)-threonylcarbamoyltransferase complex transferase subunit TsaD [Clostridia bacterium]